MKAGNCEGFFGNEGKDVKQQKFFIMNNKQYMVHFECSVRVLTLYIQYAWHNILNYYTYYYYACIFDA